MSLPNRDAASAGIRHRYVERGEKYYDTELQKFPYWAVEGRGIHDGDATGLLSSPQDIDEGGKQAYQENRPAGSE